MLTWLKIGVGALAGAFIAFTSGYFIGQSAGKQSVRDELKDSRITILKDGKQIDEKVLGADDTGLCNLLGGCVVPDGTGQQPLRRACCDQPQAGDQQLPGRQ